MNTAIIAIGNSRGIRIPKVLLEESGISGAVELIAKKGEIKIIPLKAKENARLETALLSEKSLATDWDRPEEIDAWESLQ